MSRALRALVVAGAVSIGLASSAAVRNDADAADRAPARVTLVSTGSAPRSLLRLALGEGDVVRREVEFEQHVEQSIDGTPTTTVNAPPIVMTVETTVDSVGTDGDAELSFAYTDVTVADDGSLTAAERAQFEDALQPLTSVRGTQSVTDRNQVTASSIEGLEGFDVPVAGAMSQLSDQAGSLAVPFPRKPVGLGARWRGVVELTVNGIDVRQAYEYELREREGDTIVVGVSYVQTAPRQRADLPGTPRGAEVRVTSFRVRGSGEATMDLTQALPTESAVDASGRQVFSVRAQGERGELAQDVELRVTLATPLLDRPSG